MINHAIVLVPSQLFSRVSNASEPKKESRWLLDKLSTQNMLWNQKICTTVIKIFRQAFDDLRAISISPSLI